MFPIDPIANNANETESQQPHEELLSSDLWLDLQCLIFEIAEFLNNTHTYEILPLQTEEEYVNREKRLDILNKLGIVKEGMDLFSDASNFKKAIRIANEDSSHYYFTLNDTSHDIQSIRFFIRQIPTEAGQARINFNIIYRNEWYTKETLKIAIDNHLYFENYNPESYEARKFHYNLRLGEFPDIYIPHRQANHGDHFHPRYMSDQPFIEFAQLFEQVLNKITTESKKE